jgi:DNA-binding transcriptional regulator GbsR (MarR family)
VDIDDRSQVLTGRFEAIRLWSAIGRFTKPEFTTGELASITEVSSTTCSKELKKLTEVGLLKAISRRGNYSRNESDFWSLAGALADSWTDDGRAANP